MCLTREVITGTAEEGDGLTDTGPLCPVNLYRCLHVSASQIMIRLFMSPVACKDDRMHWLHIQVTIHLDLALQAIRAATNHYFCL